MRTFDEGAFYRVTASQSDVESFASRWPCFGPRRPMSFTFDKRTGDLVDVRGDSPRHDGAGLVALSEDAMWHGADILGIDLPRVRKGGAS